MSAFVKKQRSTLYEETKRFLRWRKANGGAVLDLRTVTGRRRRDSGEGNVANQGKHDLVTIFERNERNGHYA